MIHMALFQLSVGYVLDIPQDIFAWKRYLDKKLHGSSCAPLSAFGNHIPLGIKWAERIKGMFIEFSVRSNAKLVKSVF